MVVAHADDELIWAGEKLLKEKGQWDILCVVTPDRQSKFRIPMFLKNVSNYLECNTTMLDFADTGWATSNQANPINGDIVTPIKEKITQYGPYVMNTQTEILEAMRDYQQGKMGHLY